MKYILIVAILLMALPASHLQAQNRLLFYNFDDGNLNGWVTQDSARNSVDGTANAVDPFWNSRPAIASASGNEAAMLWGDDVRGGAIRTPGFFDFSAEPALYLTFHQYFRKFKGDTYINIYQDGGLQDRILINDRLAINVETAHFDTVIVDLTPYKNIINLQIGFEHEEDGYFWLIDDVAFWDGLPVPQTTPEPMGNYLAEHNYPYEIDSARWAYVPYQLVVQFNPSADQAFRDSLLKANGAVLKERCACDKLELWEIDGSAFVDDGSGNRIPIGGSTNVQSNKIGRGSRGKVDGVDLNYYNGVLLQPQPIGIEDSLTNDSLQGLLPSDPAALKIAILDTGIDYNDETLRRYVKTSRDALNGEQQDEDGNCLLNDPIGWNFVVNNNNPYDDNSHGTHVAGIIADSLKRLIGECSFEIIPYKTHDNNGISTLFDVACATFQAIEDDADLINDSWGFFGDSSIVLSNAIDSAALEDILIVSAAGNDSLNLDATQQYPACYAADNIITVGATETFLDPNENPPEQLRPAIFTNFSPTSVDVMANGTDVESLVPGSRRETKSGTSMATPMVTAAAALALCAERNQGVEPDYKATRRELLKCINTNSSLANAAEMGRFLLLEEFAACIVLDLETPEPITVKLYPNPVENELWLESPEPLGTGELQLLSLQGQVVYQAATPVLPVEVPQRFSIPNLPSGIYILQLRAEGRIFTAKIVRY